MNDCTIIIFGASGDLAKRKIIPALYRLVERNILTKFLLIGAAIDHISSDEMLQRAQEFIENINPAVWEKLKKAALYQPLNFTNSADYADLQQQTDEYEKKYGMSGNRIIYVAAASTIFLCDYQ